MSGRRASLTRESPTTAVPSHLHHGGPFGPRPVGGVVLAWLAMLGVDVFLHAGLLAPLYDWDSPFLLRPAEAFVRIPIGYLAFGVLAVGLAWLLTRLGVEGGRDGARIAGALGAGAWGALVLGLWSISTAGPALLAGWWAGQTAELAVGGHGSPEHRDARWPDPPPPTQDRLIARRRDNMGRGRVKHRPAPLG